MKRHSTLKRVVGKHTGRAIGHALHARRKKFWTSSRRRDLNGLTTIVPKQVKDGKHRADALILLHRANRAGSNFRERHWL